MKHRAEINPFDYMLPLSSLPYVPFKTPERAKEYQDYLLDLKIRVYQHGATKPDKWVVVIIKDGTAQPIFIEKEFKRYIDEERRAGRGAESGGDYIALKTSLPDIDKMIRRVNDNMKIK